jgi:nucleoside-diphosphate-sugar epimerase
MKNILIFGGSGFIGTSLCKQLNINSNFDFTIVDKLRSKTFPNKTKIKDIRNRIQFKNYKNYVALINLAAEHKDNVAPRSLYYETNVAGARHVCNLARKNKIKKIIFTSSVAVYGSSDLIMSESSKENPNNDYGKSKLEAEKIYLNWYHEDPENRSLIIIRPTVVFGEENRGNIYNLFTLIASRKFIMIGNGLNRKSIAYVENLSAFICHCINSNSGLKIFNYADKPDFTMNNFVKLICRELKINYQVKVYIPKLVALTIASIFDVISKIVNIKFKISAIRVSKFCMNSIYSSSIRKQDFSPPYTLKDGIKRTLKYEFK